MRVRSFSKVAAAIGCTIALAAGPAAAAPSLSITEAVRTGTSATVKGLASFPAVTDAVSVGGTNTNFANPAVADAAGVDLKDAKIAPLADGSGLRFIWELTSMPAQVPPEGVRYTWAFRIGETQYQLQAKRTNLVGITTAEDPMGHVKQASVGEYYQLRGACVENYFGTPQPVAGCYHLAFLSGKMDPATKTVSMDVPFNTRDAIGRQVAPDFKPGAVLEANETAGMSITAAFQAVIGNTSTSDFTNGWTSYYTGRNVDLAVGPANSAPEDLDYSTKATLSGDSFSGTVTGLSNSANTVFARACSGLACSYTKVTPALG